MFNTKRLLQVFILLLPVDLLSDTNVTFTVSCSSLKTAWGGIRLRMVARGSSYEGYQQIR